MKNTNQKLMEELVFQLEKLKRQTNKCLKKVRKINLELEVEENEYSKIEQQKQIELINNKLNLND